MMKQYSIAKLIGATALLVTTCLVLVVAAIPVMSQYHAEPPALRSVSDARRVMNIPYDSGAYTDDERARLARWEYRMIPRSLAGGRLPSSGVLLRELRRASSLKHGAPKNNAAQSIPSQWKALGPARFEYPNGINAGTGRVNVIRQHPQDKATLFVGTPDGGIWKSTNKGTSWTALGDDIPSLGVTDIAINPQQPSTMYIATGDARAAGMYGNPYSYGLLKTLDGGLSWVSTGLSMDVSERVLVTRVVISPRNPNVLLAGVYGGDNRGIHKSTDGGTTWTRRDGGSICDIHYNLANPDLVYASGYGNFRRSTDGGDTWSSVGGVLPTWVANGVSRTLIALSPANTDVVYLTYISREKNQVYGIYRSKDKGQTFVQVFDGSTVAPFGSSGEYNLAMAVSPKDENTLIAGEQVLARSTDGGITWTQLNASIHWDHHALLFDPESDAVLYSGNDGGIYTSTDLGKTWTDLSAGLQIAQYYRVGCAAQRQDLLYCGAQDNGIQRMTGWYWEYTKSGADGAECVVDYTNENIVYFAQQYGLLMRSDNGGSGIRFISPSSNGHWITPFIMHPRQPQTLYAAYKAVYRTNDRGNNWTPVSGALAGNDNIKSLALAASNDSVLYAATYIKIFSTTNAGATWTDITRGTPAADTAAITYIAVSPVDTRRIWITFSGFSSGQHVYTSSNGGASWTNITASLPNVPVNTVVCEQLPPYGVYVGTDVGVYYRDSTMLDWEAFDSGLPNVSVSELEIVDSAGLIRAATFGRGMWQSPLRSLRTPGITALRLPLNHSSGEERYTTFVWDAQTRTRFYELHIALDSTFSQTVFVSDSISTASLSLSQPLQQDMRYYWRVRAVNEAGASHWSETWTFQTSALSSISSVTAPGTLRVHPTPAREFVTVEFCLARSGEVDLQLYSLHGNSLTMMYSEHCTAGTHSITLSTASLQSGCYFLQLQSNVGVQFIPLLID